MPTHNRRSQQHQHHHQYYNQHHPLIPTEPFHPAAEGSAFRDLLVFEERLKQAAARYARRKRKYQTLLTFLLAATVTSAYNAAATSPQWSGILDLALRWAADSDTDYRSSGLGDDTAAAAAAATGAGGEAATRSNPRIRAVSSSVKGILWERAVFATTGPTPTAAHTSMKGSASVDAPLISHPPASSQPGFFAAAAARRKSASRSRPGISSDSTDAASSGHKPAAAAAAAASTPKQQHQHTRLDNTQTSQQAHASAHADGAAMLRYYLWVGLFLFFSTTTFLFFASGLYSERIAAGATFVPQANRALRHYNLYLNTRTGGGGAAGNSASTADTAGDEKAKGGSGSTPPPSRPGLVRAASSWIWWYSDPSPTPSPTPSTPARSGRQSRSRSGSGSASDGGSGGEKDPLVTRLPPTKSSRKSGATFTNNNDLNQNVAPPPPPSTNPRGELLLGPRVSAEFRHGYESYRAEFERRRALRLEAQRRGYGIGWRAWRAVKGAVGLGAVDR